MASVNARIGTKTGTAGAMSTRLECFRRRQAMATSSPHASPKEPVRLVTRPEEPAAGQSGGDPAMVALPSFIVGSVALAMVLIGFVPATATGAAMPIILAAALGMFLATIWAARVGENVSAGITGVFGGFFLSYALLVLG